MPVAITHQYQIALRCDEFVNLDIWQRGFYHVQARVYAVRDGGVTAVGAGAGTSTVVVAARPVPPLVVSPATRRLIGAVDRPALFPPGILPRKQCAVHGTFARCAATCRPRLHTAVAHTSTFRITHKDDRRWLHETLRFDLVLPGRAKLRPGASPGFASIGSASAPPDRRDPGTAPGPPLTVPPSPAAAAAAATVAAADAVTWTVYAELALAFVDHHDALMSAADLVPKQLLTLRLGAVVPAHYVFRDAQDRERALRDAAMRAAASHYLPAIFSGVYASHLDLISTCLPCGVVHRPAHLRRYAAAAATAATGTAGAGSRMGTALPSATTSLASLSDAGDGRPAFGGPAAGTPPRFSRPARSSVGGSGGGSSWGGLVTSLLSGWTTMTASLSHRSSDATALGMRTSSRSLRGTSARRSARHSRASTPAGSQSELAGAPAAATGAAAAASVATSDADTDTDAADGVPGAPPVMVMTAAAAAPVPATLLDALASFLCHVLIDLLDLAQILVAEIAQFDRTLAREARRRREASVDALDALRDAAVGLNSQRRHHVAALLLTLEFRLHEACVTHLVAQPDRPGLLMDPMNPAAVNPARGVHGGGGVGGVGVGFHESATASTAPVASASPTTTGMLAQCAHAMALHGRDQNPTRAADTLMRFAAQVRDILAETVATWGASLTLATRLDVQLAHAHTRLTRWRVAQRWAAGGSVLEHVVAANRPVVTPLADADGDRPAWALAHRRAAAQRWSAMMHAFPAPQLPAPHQPLMRAADLLSADGHPLPSRRSPSRHGDGPGMDASWHLIVCVHGFMGAATDFRHLQYAFRHFYELMDVPRRRQPRFLLSTVNEQRTQESITVLADRFAQELLGTLMGSERGGATGGAPAVHAVTFIGHSLGGLVIRRALHLPAVQAALCSRRCSLVTLATPHIGQLLHRNPLLSSMLSALRWAQHTASVNELFLADRLGAGGSDGVREDGGGGGHAAAATAAAGAASAACAATVSAAATAATLAASEAPMHADARGILAAMAGWPDLAGFHRICFYASRQDRYVPFDSSLARPLAPPLRPRQPASVAVPGPGAGAEGNGGKRDAPADADANTDADPRWTLAIRQLPPLPRASDAAGTVLSIPPFAPWAPWSASPSAAVADSPERLTVSPLGAAADVDAGVDAGIDPSAAAGAGAGAGTVVGKVADGGRRPRGRAPSLPALSFARAPLVPASCVGPTAAVAEARAKPRLLPALPAGGDLGGDRGVMSDEGGQGGDDGLTADARLYSELVSRFLACNRLAAPCAAGIDTAGDAGDAAAAAAHAAALASSHRSATARRTRTRWASAPSVRLGRRRECRDGSDSGRSVKDGDDDDDDGDDGDASLPTVTAAAEAAPTAPLPDPDRFDRFEVRFSAPPLLSVDGLLGRGAHLALLTDATVLRHVVGEVVWAAVAPHRGDPPAGSVPPSASGSALAASSAGTAVSPRGPAS